MLAISKSAVVLIRSAALSASEVCRRLSSVLKPLFSYSKAASKHNWMGTLLVELAQQIPLIQPLLIVSPIIKEEMNHKPFIALTVD